MIKYKLLNLTGLLHKDVPYRIVNDMLAFQDLFSKMCWQTWLILNDFLCYKTEERCFYE